MSPLRSTSAADSPPTRLAGELPRVLDERLALGGQGSDLLAGDDIDAPDARARRAWPEDGAGRGWQLLEALARCGGCRPVALDREEHGGRLAGEALAGDLLGDPPVL